jgi:hypothetical protein
MLSQYQRLLPWLTMAARHHGYALLVHGSGQRDLDLVAVPWVAGASTGDALAEVVRQIAGAVYSRTKPTPRYWKPHGRRAYTLLLLEEHDGTGDRRLNGQLLYIDLSVMPVKEEE